LRLWFKEHSDPYKDAMLPEAPADMVAELSRRYIEIYEQLTGEIFRVDQNENPLSRMEKNLRKYSV
jgi:phosphoribosylaminoimidazole-succinocarboxamide synthase